MNVIIVAGHTCTYLVVTKCFLPVIVDLESKKNKTDKL